MIYVIFTTTTVQTFEETSFYFKFDDNQAHYNSFMVIIDIIDKL